MALAMRQKIVALDIFFIHPAPPLSRPNHRDKPGRTRALQMTLDGHPLEGSTMVKADKAHYFLTWKIGEPFWQDIS